MDLRVAIVDDDPRDREALEAGIRATASAEGVRCSLRSYAGADEMLAVFAPGSLDLAFLDVLMPGTDGLELAVRPRRPSPAFEFDVFAISSLASICCHPYRRPLS